MDGLKAADLELRLEREIRRGVLLRATSTIATLDIQTKYKSAFAVTASQVAAASASPFLLCLTGRMIPLKRSGIGARSKNGFGPRNSRQCRPVRAPKQLNRMLIFLAKFRPIMPESRIREWRSCQELQ
jgi:hypothetical protein